MSTAASTRLALPDNDQPLPHLATGVVIALCAAKFLLHAFTSMRNYGYFRDELYYLDMARHLDWGYVDAAPLVAVDAKLDVWMGMPHGFVTNVAGFNAATQALKRKRSISNRAAGEDTLGLTGLRDRS